MSDVAFPHDEYKAALREERAIREEIFLDLPAKICGIRIQQITPFLLARLRFMETPFLMGGNANATEIIRFLWALSSDFSANRDEMDEFVESALKLIGDNWHDAEDGIDEFISKTFLDAPRGSGGESVPYVTGSAWMIYKMGCDPFNWLKERTLHTPVREIYQYMRCHRIDNGGILYNEISDKIKATWLDELNKQIGGRN